MSKTSKNKVVQVVPFHSPTRPAATSINRSFDPRACSASQKKAFLEQLKAHIGTEFGAYYQMEREAAMRAVKMGLMLKSAKETLFHGEFMPWCEQNIPIKDRQINKFMKLAEFFLQNAKLPAQDVLLLTDGEQGSAEQKNAQQLLLDFVGDRSQAELFAHYGVTGGKREITGHRRTMEDIDREEAATIWGRERLGEIAAHGVEKKTWRFLERKELELAFEVFRQTTEAMKAELKVRHGIK